MIIIHTVSAERTPLGELFHPHRHPHWKVVAKGGDDGRWTVSGRFTLADKKGRRDLVAIIEEADQLSGSSRNILYDNVLQVFLPFSS